MHFICIDEYIVPVIKAWFYGVSYAFLYSIYILISIHVHVLIYTIDFYNHFFKFWLWWTNMGT